MTDHTFPILVQTGSHRPPARELVTRFFRTDASRSRAFQRAVLAAVVFPHGVQKLLGGFGGWGFEGTVRWFAEALHVPAPLAVLVIASDFFGAIALFAGAFSRLAAFGIASTMLGAILLLHAPNGFFMNWSGTLAGEGYEFHLLALALAIPLVISGGGAWSLDSWMLRRLSARRSTARATENLP
jgi:putative oxidoreductase